MTFWWSNDNYGQLLQCYALQQFLKNNGHNPYLIRYHVQKKKFIHYLQKAFNIKFLYKWLINRSKVKTEQKIHDRHFDDFRKKYIEVSDNYYSTIKQLKENPPDADAYIVGSDQVWNTFHNSLNSIKMRIHAYFLDFGTPETKRLSYAASWGIKELPDDFITEIAPLLKKFDYVSVREESGLELCSQCGCSDAEWVCDPTELISADEYRALYNSEKTNIPSNKYILLYLLKSPIEIDIDEIYKFANSKNLSVVYITGNGRIDEYNKTFATIPEWLCLLDNAEYVITNSYHCSVFSTIFHKKYGVLKVVGKNKQMNSRFDSLFNLRSTGNRYILNKDFSVLDLPYNTTKVAIPKNFLKILAE